jgi:hypothetical protein
MAILRDLSIILIALEAFIFALVPLVVLGALVYGVSWLRRHENLPHWLKMARAYESLGQAYVELAAAYIVRPFFFFHSVMARVQRWLVLIVKTGGDNQ